jgi:hypothetical protein
MGLIGCPETSVRNCHYALRNIAQKRRSHLETGKLTTRLSLVPVAAILRPWTEAVALPFLTYVTVFPSGRLAIPFARKDQRTAYKNIICLVCVKLLAEDKFKPQRDEVTEKWGTFSQ